MVVHQYDEVDDDRVVANLDDVDDLAALVAQVSGWLVGAASPRSAAPPGTRRADAAVPMPTARPPARSFTLVHSPLVGPRTWAGVGRELAGRGHEVSIPSLTDAATTGRWEACVEAAVDGACRGGGAHVLVGHSGAGPLLPVIAGRLDPSPDAIVFVDAGLPPTDGDAALVPAQFREHLRSLVDADGRLPPWSEWFGPGVMSQLIPAEPLRRAVVTELPRVPLSYFDRSVPMPPGWEQMHGHYILLSEPYADELIEARARGWPTVELRGAHLDMVTRPAVIADALIEILGQR